MYGVNEQEDSIKFMIIMTGLGGIEICGMKWF